MHSSSNFVMGLPVLAQRLKAAIPAVAESDSALRKVLILISVILKRAYDLTTPQVDRLCDR